MSEPMNYPLVPIQSVSILHHDQRYHLTISVDNTVQETAGPYYVFEGDVCEDACNHIGALLEDRVKCQVIYTPFGPVIVYHVWKLTEDRDAIDQAIYEMIDVCQGCMPPSSHMTMKIIKLHGDRQQEEGYHLTDEDLSDLRGMLTDQESDIPGEEGE